MAALTYAATIIMLPVTLSHFFGIGSSLAITCILHFRVQSDFSFFRFIFSFLFGWAFLYPRKTSEKGLPDKRLAHCGN